MFDKLPSPWASLSGAADAFRVTWSERELFVSDTSPKSSTEKAWEDAVKGLGKKWSSPQMQPHWVRGASRDGCVLRLRVLYRVSHKVSVNVGSRSPFFFYKRNVVEWICQSTTSVHKVYIYMSDANLDICSKQTEDK